MQQRAKSRSLAWCALQCDAGSIKQAAIHGATVSRLRVIAGPALGFEHRRKTERERGARQGGQEKRKRTSRRRSRVRKKGIAGDSGGRGEEGWGGTVKRVIRARACVHEQHEIVFAESQASSPLRDKPGLSRSSRTELHEKISPGPRHPPPLKAHPRKVRKRLYMRRVHSNAERSDLVWWNDRDNIVENTVI